MVTKGLTVKMEGLRKEGRVIRDFLDGREAILSNDSAIWLSTFRKELVQYQGLIQDQENILAKRLKEELQHTFSNEMMLIRKESEEKMRSLLEKSDLEKNLLRQ